MKILLLGKDGQVGWELQRSLAPLGELISLGRADSSPLCGDLTQTKRLTQSIRDIHPDVIVNAAAYTAVDKAESEPESARTINEIAPGVLAEEAKRINALLIHYSTDYVFDGTGTQPWLEISRPAPLNTYGRTKYAGEKRIQDTGCRHLIFRTSWVYASRGKNFVKTILRLAQERESLSIVGDQFGAPTGAELLADVTAIAIRQTARSRQGAVPDSGLYHLAASGETSWYEFARFIVEETQRLGRSLKTTPGNIVSIATEAYPTPAQRPKNSRLDTTHLRQTFDITLPDWRLGVSRTISELIQESTQ